MAEIPNKPETRKETYLAAIAGQNVDLPPYPITREEAYLNEIAKNGGGGGGGGYVLPTATESRLGGVKIGSGISVEEDGTISTNGGSGTSNYNQLTNKPQINSIELSGNKTSADLGLQDAIQIDTMPTASATYADKVVQYLGETDLSYTHGLFYECVENNGVYSWQTTTVQALSNHYSGSAILDIGYAFSLEGARSMYSELKNAMSGDVTDQYKRTLTTGATRVVIDGFNLDSQMVEGKYGTDCEYLIADIYTSKDGLGTTDVIVSKTDPETQILSTSYSMYVYFPEQSENVDVLIVLRKAKV